MTSGGSLLQNRPAEWQKRRFVNAIGVSGEKAKHIKNRGGHKRRWQAVLKRKLPSR